MKRGSSECVQQSLMIIRTIILYLAKITNVYIFCEVDYFFFIESNFDLSIMHTHTSIDRSIINGDYRCPSLSLSLFNILNSPIRSLYIYIQ